VGVWGTALYSGDFAMDLRRTIRALARLPFDGERLAAILSASDPGAANNPADEDHTTFWLVVADQFARRGITCDSARERALSIIDDGTDLAMLQRLGMTPPGLAKRRKVLEEARGRIVAPADGSKPRSVLSKPQILVMELGDVLVYPTSKGKCINPYFPSKEAARWNQDGWSAQVIVDRGRAFGFLSWYRPVILTHARDTKPTVDSLYGDVPWKLGRPGTCSAQHFKRMELEKLGTLALDETKLRVAFPDMPRGVSAAVNDISIANAMHSAPPGTTPRTFGRPDPTIEGIEQIPSG
jgi:hypothetical protein